MQSHSVDISFVIVSWNVADLLAACLQSITYELESAKLTAEVIVVDNASVDQTLSMLHAQFPWVQVIANKGNAGFARANNQGFTIATGDLVFILNPDTVLRPGALHRLVALLKQHPEIGMVGPKLFYGNGELQMSAARPLPTLLTAIIDDALSLYRLFFFGRWFQRYVAPYDYEHTQEVEAISGAAMLVRRAVLTRVGGFYEGYLHGGEDVELCLRFRECGQKVFYVHDAIILHYAGQSSIQDLVRVVPQSILSKQLYMQRCYGPRHALLFRLIIQCLFVPKMLLFSLIRLLQGQEKWPALATSLKIAGALWLWRSSSSALKGDTADL